MTPLHTIVLLASLSAGGASPAPAATPADALSEIEARYRRGALDVERYHLYRVAAVKAPQRLPADLRPLVGQVRRRSGTGVLVEAMQHVLRTGDWGGAIHNLLQPPPDLTHTLESSTWPLRVSYATPGQAGYAQAVLDAAELAWTVQIGDFGFHQPVLEPGFEPYRFYVEDAGSGTAGYTSPYDSDPGSAHNACFTYIVIGPNLGSGVGATVTHEVNHSMQLTMDCLEQRAFLENTAMFVEGLTHPDYVASSLGFVQFFQAEPWKAVNYFVRGEYYPYGGILWLNFLADTLAVPDSGVFIREVWEASMQDAALPNEPDYFDGIETVAAAYGADASDMASLYADFAEARYFVGSQDDGQHMTDAALFTTTPTVGLRHSVEDLPLVERQPPLAQRPAAFGTNYVRLTVTPEWEHEVSVRFDGDEGVRWEVRVLLVGDGQSTVAQTLVLDPATNVGLTTVDPVGYDEVLLVVVNAGPEGFDPDTGGHPLSSYYYSLEPVVAPAVVNDIVPAAVIRGHQNLHMRLRGENFVYGPDFEIRFHDPMLQVMSIDGFTPSQVMFTLTVPAGASLGPYDVTVVNGGGQEATAVGLVTVVDELATPTPSPKPKGCQTGTTSGPLPWLWALAVLLCLLRRRRRR